MDLLGAPLRQLAVAEFYKVTAHSCHVAGAVDGSPFRTTRCKTACASTQKYTAKCTTLQRNLDLEGASEQRLGKWRVKAIETCSGEGTNPSCLDVDWVGSVEKESDWMDHPPDDCWEEHEKGMVEAR